MKKDILVVFDFDGTITKKDSFLEFVKFAKGKIAFYVGFILYSPLLVLYKLRCYPNWRVKLYLFSYYFKGMSLNEFDKLAVLFCDESINSLIRPKAKGTIEKYLANHNKIIIISASVDNWVKPIARRLGIEDVIGTQIEIDKNNCLTGKFISKNCYGREKVNRLKEYYPNIEETYLIAFGDSRGDKELLLFANESYYQLF